MASINYTYHPSPSTLHLAMATRVTNLDCCRVHSIIQSFNHNWPVLDWRPHLSERQEDHLVSPPQYPLDLDVWNSFWFLIFDCWQVVRTLFYLKPETISKKKDVFFLDNDVCYVVISSITVKWREALHQKNNTYATTESWDVTLLTDLRIYICHYLWAAHELSRDTKLNHLASLADAQARGTDDGGPQKNRSWKTGISSCG